MNSCSNLEKNVAFAGGGGGSGGGCVRGGVLLVFSLARKCLVRKTETEETMRELRPTE